ncbi:MAG TPA: hypothetical protein VK203_22700 [Nostocaceae cyanobacterium]|nr:hypothetical protein [Nostocaceae cyanobacterium]
MRLSRKCPHRVSKKSNISSRSIKRSKPNTASSTVGKLIEVKAPFELLENCIRETVAMQFICKCRFCGGRNLETWGLAIHTKEPIILAYRHCLNCGKIQEPSISKLLGLVKGGAR